MVNDGSYSDILQLKTTILSVNPMRKQLCKLGRVSNIDLRKKNRQYREEIRTHGQVQKGLSFRRL